MRALLTLPLICLLLAVPACNSSATGPTGPTPIEEENFAPWLGIVLSQMTRTDSGLYYQDLILGSGDPAEVGNKVWVHYVGWLTTGWSFDSSTGRPPAEFTIGEGKMIAGWEEGVQGMRVGGTRRLIIPSHLAYAEKGSGNIIPAHATLVFEISLIEMR